MSLAYGTREQDSTKRILPLPSEPRLESMPLGLPVEMAERVAAFLPPNEVALVFRLVHKATAALADEMTIVRLSQPVPEDAFARRWSDPGTHSCHTQPTDDQCRQLLRLTCGAGVVANMAVATRTAELNSLRAEDIHRVYDVAAAAGGGHLAAVQWLRAQGCPWDGSVQEAAAAGGHTEVVAWLAGARCPWAGGSPLSAALRSGKYDTVRQLLDLGCPVDSAVYQLAANRGQKRLVESLLSRGLTTERLGAILLGAAAGYPLPDLQEILPRLAAGYMANVGNSVRVAQAEQLLLNPPSGGVVLGAAAVGVALLADGCSAPPDVPLLYSGSEWQAKVLWLVQDKGLRRVVRWDGGEQDGDGFPLMGAAEQARRLEWLRGNGFQVEVVHTPEAQRRRRSAMERAARGGDVAALRWVLAKHAECLVQPEFDGRWGWVAAQRGYVEVVEELLARGLLTRRDAAHGAAAGGRLRLLSRLLRGGVQGTAGGEGWSLGPAVAAAAMAGAMGGSSPAGAQGQEALDELLQADLFLTAASSDRPRWEVLRWLRDRGCPWDEAVFGAAVRRCSVEVVEWMAAEGCPMPADSSLCTTAAARGDEALLRCLRRLGCPWDAGAIAACTCGVEVVEWMAAEGCPMPTDTSACVAAAQRGDAATLRCLRRLGCPWGEDVFRAAVGACHVEVVEWLAAEGCPMPVNGSPYSDALARGRMDMLDCLRRLGCPWGPGRLLHEVVRDGARLERLQWLMNNRYPATEWEVREALVSMPRDMVAERRAMMRWRWQLGER